MRHELTLTHEGLDYEVIYELDDEAEKSGIKFASQLDILSVTPPATGYDWNCLALTVQCRNAPAISL